jgi:hypothetical protein
MQYFWLLIFIVKEKAPFPAEAEERGAHARIPKEPKRGVAPFRVRRLLLQQKFKEEGCRDIRCAFARPLLGVSQTAP